MKTGWGNSAWGKEGAGETALQSFSIRTGFMRKKDGDRFFLVVIVVLGQRTMCFN